MTVHAAKGLEFPITVVSGLTTRVQGTRAMSVVWPGDGWALAERDSALFEAFKPLDEQMGDAERRRLLYVACTRAVDHLVVSLHRKPENVADGTAKATSATVLAEAGARGHGAAPIDAAADAARARRRRRPLELPWADAAAWDAERARAVAAASVRSTTSATRLAVALDGGGHGPTPPRAPLDAGLAKDAVDLDLPPWQRGRYGTAIGRAVHAVLQDADLRRRRRHRPPGRRPVRRRGHLRLRAPGRRPVPLGARRADRRRPRPPAPSTGASCSSSPSSARTVLEGYIDLLVRTPAGLVIVDYKTDQWKPGADQAERVRPLPAPAGGLRRWRSAGCSTSRRRRRPRALPARRPGRGDRHRAVGRGPGRGRRRPHGLDPCRDRGCAVAVPSIAALGRRAASGGCASRRGPRGARRRCGRPSRRPCRRR